MYYIISFISGMAIMIIELASIELTSSYINNTNIVCTSIIGAIMTSLSLGYFIGGKLSKYNPTNKKLAIFLLVSALYVLSLILFQLPFINYICILNISDITKALLLAIILFAFPSMLLGSITPYIIQLDINETKKYKKAGNISGKLSAISTIGSIIGTFLCGFYFNIKFNTIVTYVFLSLILFICTLLCFIPVTKNNINKQQPEIISDEN